MQEERNQRNLVDQAPDEENKNRIVRNFFYGLYLNKPPASIIFPIRSGNGFIE
ncbi:MAG: hypothetical protein CM1200mP23_0450 [Nitrososphaerota archaeon]|nr:MAG: hypothetical protein CM1200mP23_0450 [Nitrososphaerota archaeon]